MHILIIPSENYLPDEGNLQGVFQQHQAYALKAAGYKVGIISPILRSIRSFPSHWGLWGLRAEENSNLNILRYFGWYYPRSDSNRAQDQWTSAGIDLFNDYRKRYGCPDLIHAHNALYAGILANKIAESSSVPYIITEHHTAYRRNLILPDDVPRIKNAYQCASAKIVVSSFLGEDLVRVIGDAGLGWECIPNVLPPIFEGTSVPSISQRNNSFCFLNVASLDEKKGHQDLLHAYADAFRNRADVFLRIVGDGPLKGTLEKLVSDLNIEGSVCFAGIQDHTGVLREMQNCDAFVLSSRYETFGVVVIEALACGKPVVATRCGGPGGVIEKGDGILVPPNNRESLSEAMTVMVDQRLRFSDRTIRDNCVRRFGAASFAKSIGMVYSRVLAARNS